MTRAEAWQAFRSQHGAVPAKQIEDLWRNFCAQNGVDADATTTEPQVTEAPKRRGRPPGSKNRVTESTAS